MSRPPKKAYPPRERRLGARPRAPKKPSVRPPVAAKADSIRARTGAIEQNPRSQFVGGPPAHADAVAAVNIVARRQLVFERFKAGATYRAAGEAAGCSDWTAFQDVKAVLADLVNRTALSAHEWRVSLLESLRRLEVAHWSRAVGYVDRKGRVVAADHGSAKIVLNIIRQMRELTGADMPKVLRVETPVARPSDPDAALHARYRQLAAVLGRPDIDVPAAARSGNGSGHGPGGNGAGPGGA
jgi:hypothetical protein